MINNKGDSHEKTFKFKIEEVDMSNAQLSNQKLKILIQNGYMNKF